MISVFATINAATANFWPASQQSFMVRSIKIGQTIHSALSKILIMITHGHSPPVVLCKVVPHNVLILENLCLLVISSDPS